MRRTPAATGRSWTAPVRSYVAGKHSPIVSQTRAEGEPPGPVFPPAETDLLAFSSKKLADW
ncbi:hypothetical protein CKO51_15690 [Rhodopirellula sp. SM50]|nr:hypothetical protein CKO51_15690 [Rhodopirellula sp. SM50]